MVSQVERLEDISVDIDTISNNEEDLFSEEIQNEQLDLPDENGSVSDEAGHFNPDLYDAVSTDDTSEEIEWTSTADEILDSQLEYLGGIKGLLRSFEKTSEIIEEGPVYRDTFTDYINSENGDKIVTRYSETVKKTGFLFWSNYVTSYDPNDSSSFFSITHTDENNRGLFHASAYISRNENEEGFYVSVQTFINESYILEGVKRDASDFPENDKVYFEEDGHIEALSGHWEYADLYTSKTFSGERTSEDISQQYYGHQHFADTIRVANPNDFDESGNLVPNERVIKLEFDKGTDAEGNKIIEFSNIRFNSWDTITSIAEDHYNDANYSVEIRGNNPGAFDVSGELVPDEVSLILPTNTNAIINFRKFVSGPILD
jgi:hypothetical protein